MQQASTFTWVPAKRKSSLFCRKRHHNASYRWHPSFCHNRIIFESSAGRIWFPCRCSPACPAIRPCDGDRFSFLILTIGSGHLIRADGSPKMAMFVNISGAVINIVLDAVFVLGFHWGMYGAAAATVIGQVISAIIAVCYLSHYRTVTLHSEHFRPNASHLAQICSLGMASAINQVAMMIVQITMNNLLKHYGAQSVYGESIPIACSGIVMKVNQLYFSVIIGLSQGSQPIQSFNYGAKQYNRVKRIVSSGDYGRCHCIHCILSAVSDFSATDPRSVWQRKQRIF